MFQKDLVVDDDVLAGAGEVWDASVDHRVVRDPEIVWVSDVPSGFPDGDVRSIPELLTEIEGALSRLDLGQAEDVCWEAWSLSRDARAHDLANAIELLAFALDGNSQLYNGVSEERDLLLKTVRDCFLETSSVREVAAERAA